MRQTKISTISGPALQVLGLSLVAELVYRTLLDRPSLAVPELAVHLGVEPAAVCDAIEELEALALVSPSADKVGEFRAANPEIGLQALVARRQADLERQQREIADGRLMIARMVSEYEDRTPPDQSGAERLIGMDAVGARIEYLAASARSECLSFMPGRAQSAASLAASRPLDEAALRRDVVLWTVYQDSVRNDPGTLAYADWLVASGGEVRTAPVLPSRLIIVDRLVALVPLDTANSRAGALQLTGTGAVACLRALFELVWASADPLARVPERGSGGITAQQAELLRLLGDGLTDEAAANRLGVSQRTARRMMAELMALLGARSRFEAGRLAAQRGWV